MSSYFTYSIYRFRHQPHNAATYQRHAMPFPASSAVHCSRPQASKTDSKTRYRTSRLLPPFPSDIVPLDRSCDDLPNINHLRLPRSLRPSLRARCSLNFRRHHAIALSRGIKVPTPQRSARRSDPGLVQTRTSRFTQQIVPGIHAHNKNGRAAQPSRLGDQSRNRWLKVLACAKT